MPSVPMIIGGVVFIGLAIMMSVMASNEKTAKGATTKYKGLMAGGILFGIIGLGMMGYAFVGGGGASNANTSLPTNNIRQAVRNATTKAQVDQVIAANVDAAVAEKSATIAATAAENAQVAANAAAAQAAAGKANADRVAAGLQAKLSGNQASLHALGDVKKGSLDAIAAAGAAGQAATQA